MITSQRAAISVVAPEILTFDYRPQPFFSGRAIWNRLIIIPMIILTVFFVRPKEAAVEISLSPDNILEIINQDRAKLSLKPLQMNSSLSRAAYSKAAHMFRHSYFAHTSPEGIEPWDFIKEQNFPYSFAGENLAVNYTSSYELEQDFLGSPSHKANILSPLFSQTGIAVVQGELKGEPVVVTVQIFASPVPNIIGLQDVK